MELLLVRHAIAADAAEWARTHVDDADRPLTPEGERKMRKTAKGLRSLLPGYDVLATSPLTRARQTAQILYEAYGGAQPVVVDALAPGQPIAAFAAWLEGQSRHGLVMAVGHAPSLSRTVGWLIAGTERSVIELKKGGVCLLQFPRGIAPGSATLGWALTPGQLRDRAD